MGDLPAYLAPTFAERRAARLAAESDQPEVKQVDAESEVEDKAVRQATAKRPAKRAAKKS